MKKFRVRVKRTDEYVIEIDEDIINQEFIDSYKEFFSDIDTLEEYAKNGERFIEGYGNPMVSGRLPWMIKEEDAQKGINITKIISEDDFYNMDIEIEGITE